MPEFIRVLFDAAQAGLEGVLGFLGALGGDGRGRFVTALILFIVFVLVTKFWGGRAGALIASLILGSALFALARGIGLSADLGTLIAAIVIGLAAFRVTTSSFKNRSWPWAGGAAVIFTMMLFAVFGLSNSNFLGGQLPRDMERAASTISNVVTKLTDAARAGLNDNNRQERQDRPNRNNEQGQRNN